MELTTKSMVCRCLKMRRTPSGVVASTLDALQKEERRPWFRSPVWWRWILEQPAAKPVIALVVAVVAFIVIFSRPGGSVRATPTY